ncbi:MAG: CBS domain-containing protein [Candidatus Aenigmatarchaeota archaeon]|nr:CBS domain-containing protein [Candidatus Aenigmarchaeota archaeon]
MNISKIKLENQKTASPDENLFQVSKKMGVSKSIIILDGKRPVGILTMRDIVTRALVKGKDPKTTLVKDIMTTPVFCAKEDDDIEKIAAFMLQKDYLTVPVVNKKEEYKGVLSLRQIIMYKKSKQK